MSYTIVVLWLFIILLTIILIKLLNIKSNILFCIICSIFIVLFILNIKQCTIAAIDGCKLWYSAVLPVTFPFLVICNLLISYDGISLYSKLLGPLICKPLGLSKNCSFPIVASFLCGYPLGAKYSIDLWSLGSIDDKECQRLLNIASNVGPLFLIGSVGTALLNNTALGYILLIANYLSAIFIGLITKKNRTLRKPSSKSSINEKNLNFGQAIKNAIGNGVNTILSICGFIVIFSVIISLIKNNAYINNIFDFLENLLHIQSGTLFSIFLGSIEMTNGCNLISDLNISLPLKLGIISFLCSFSGLSVIAQISSFMNDFNISYFKYISLKLIQGIFSFVITYLLIKIIPTSIVTSNFPVACTINPFMYLLPILLLLTLTIVLKIIYKLFFHTS
ncbi:MULTISPECIES: sporulation integral membrane protein YlbJ [Clostridium]|uniref:Sporulation integral membrane protein YlbJ n=1 Tax=Clostridium botulinum (strain Eklund 17B / Type B) TaxID=935198 RepID=B2TJ14_CLOBB|nr:MULTISPECIES: sporulation integral membrane protein YlbJ [Clostridium]ACD24685.1 sporulation integral membrane protein YlbJ [Clostridium botulinum B str. Eklund 17B (NRP)]MBN1051584.1 sporulation integral membrane protein YlbJ [Clostridium botulinum]MBN1054812.1 sporulation integral membrane protein YlbJ [Clostridium botulinum]MBY6974946.1 sporulation integral membrane protein YlbJ [Clostridium botulinum]MBY6999926.1 sporulation integral membrane protein YlbJ [Clostridium botulinum]